MSAWLHPPRSRKRPFLLRILPLVYIALCLMGALVLVAVIDRAMTQAAFDAANHELWKG